MAINSSELIKLLDIEPFPSVVDIEEPSKALRRGSVPDAAVPTLSRSANEPMSLNRIGLLFALFQLGYRRLPVLATVDAARALRHRFDVMPMLSSWHLIE